MPKLYHRCLNGHNRLEYQSIREAWLKYAPDGREVASVRIVCGDGSPKYPSMYVEVPVWQGSALAAVDELDRKGINVVVEGWVLISDYVDVKGQKVEPDKKIRVWDVVNSLYS